MLPAGKPLDDMLFGDGGLVELLDEGDFVIDGGNSFYKDAAARAPRLAEAGLRFLDCGTSGGPYGARHGACLMIGGHEEDFEEIESLFADIAQPDGYQFFEGPGAGHFVKMVHNGIEYGMMQAIAEGFQIMKLSRYELDLTRVADVYQNGSVIESRLVGWLEAAFVELGEDLKGASGTVGHTGEGAWTVETAREMGLDARVIQGALDFRVESEHEPKLRGAGALGSPEPVRRARDVARARGYMLLMLSSEGSMSGGTWSGPPRISLARRRAHCVLSPRQ